MSALSNVAQAVMFSIVGIGIGCQFLPSPLHAQVVPDRTLPNPTQVTREQNGGRTITGGTQSGNNLFHSFRQFSVRENRRASFQGINSDIDRIISRVTGRSVSRINGIIEVLQDNHSISNADLFLINPNGIVFGPNASLNIGGSFLATTAERLTFADGIEFSARHPQNSSLLSVRVPIGLQFGADPQPIRHRSVANLIEQNGVPIAGGLQVPAGHTLALVGGNVILNDSVSIAIGGRIEIGSVGRSVSVPLASSQLASPQHELRVRYHNVPSFQAVRLRNARLNTSGAGTGAGAIHLQGDTVQIREFSRLFAGSFGTNNGEDITIRASRLRVDDGSFASTNTFGSGQGGNIDVVVDDLIMAGGAQLFSNVGQGATGRGGDVQITARSINISGGQPTESDFLASGLRAVVFPDASGQGGNVQVTGDRLILRDGAQIAADTRGIGNAGDITLEVNSLVVDGVARTHESPLLIDAGNQRVTIPSTITALTLYHASKTREENASPQARQVIPEARGGNGGDINLHVERLQVSDGATIQASTLGSGNAGHVRLRARESVVLEGIVAGSPSGLFSFSGGIPGTRFDDIGNPDATGQGGTLSIDTEDLVVRDNAVIAVGSLNANNPRAISGAINLQADSVQFLERGNLLSATASGNGGNIVLDADTLLLLQQTSLISATAGLGRSGGDGGNIRISSPFIIAPSQENSDIIANAFTGSGGQITITTQGIFGIEFRPNLTLRSDITASSEFGLDGTVVINTPDIDPNRGTVELPSTLVDASTLLASDLCELSRDSHFISVGRGGMPPGPDDLFTSDVLWQDQRLVSVDETYPGREEGAIAPSPHGDTDATHQPPTPTPVIEAQGWITDSMGNIKLITNAPEDMTQGRWIPSSVSCSDITQIHYGTAHID